MARERSKDILGRDDAGRCKVLVKEISNSVPGAATEFQMVYSQWKQNQLIKKYVPKRLRATFKDILLFQTIRDSKLPLRENDLIRN